jgi:hypothetical protein
MRRATGLFLAAVGMLGVVLGFAILVLGLTDHTGSHPENTRVKGYLVGAESREHLGRGYEVVFRPRGRGKNPHPSLLTVRVPVATAAEVHLSRENWFDRLFKWAGIAREHQTGDADFDSTVYIRSRSPRYAAACLKHPARRGAVLAILSQRFASVRIADGFATAEWPGFDPETHGRPGVTEDAADALFVLTESLPKRDPGENDGRLDGHALAKGVLWWALIASAVTVLSVCFFPPVRTWDLFLPVLGVFVLGYLAFGWLSALLLRGTSTSHDSWAKLMAVGVFLWALGSLGLVAGVNGLADTGPPEWHTLTVSDRTYEHRKNGRSYYLTAPAWDGGAPIRLEVSSADYNAAQPGRSRLEVEAGRGRLGIPWLKAKRTIP